MVAGAEECDEGVTTATATCDADCTLPACGDGQHNVAVGEACDGVGVSLPTVDDEVRRHFEPRAASVAERLELLEKVRAAGVHAIAVVQPLLPGSHDDLVEALARRVDSVSIDVLRGEEGAGVLFDDPRYVDMLSRDPARLWARITELSTMMGTGEAPPGMTTAEVAGRAVLLPTKR